MRRLTLFLLASFVCLGPVSSTALTGAEEWELILRQGVLSQRSQTRYEAIKQVDTTQSRGLRSIFSVLSNKDPNLVDWYVREGAYEALLSAEGEDAEKEIDRVLRGSGNELPKEAIVYAVIWKIRKEVVKAYGGNDDRKIEMAKFYLRKKRGVEYFDYVLPVIKKIDPEKKLLGRILTALEDRSERVRRAALTGLMAYPDTGSIPLLLDHLKGLEKKKARQYREWVLTRAALETLTGQYYREVVTDWFRWWDTVKGQFTIEKRIAEETEKEDENAGRTVVVTKQGVEVTVHMKIAGPPDGYPLLVVPWRGYEVDYFRPYFHGIEEFCRTYYVRMPSLDDYKGLARDAGSNLVNYPTEILAEALIDLMDKSGLEAFGVLAHGPDASILALSLIGEHSDKVTHVVLINPRSAGDVYGNSIQNVRREGANRKNDEIVNGADSIQLGEDNKPKYLAADPGEQGGLNRALTNLHFADPTEPEIGAMDYLYRLPGGTSVLNDRSWSAKQLLSETARARPALIFMGLRSPWTPLGDMEAVASLFQRPVVVKLPDGAEDPFISHTYLFTKHVEKFFEGAKKAAAKSKSSGSSGSTRSR